MYFDLTILVGINENLQVNTLQRIWEGKCSFTEGIYREKHQICYFRQNYELIDSFDCILFLSG